MAVTVRDETGQDADADRAADHRLYPPSARTPDRAFQVVLCPR